MFVANCAASLFFLYLYNKTLAVVNAGKRGCIVNSELSSCAEIIGRRPYFQLPQVYELGYLTLVLGRQICVVHAATDA